MEGPAEPPLPEPLVGALRLDARRHGAWPLQLGEELAMDHIFQLTDDLGPGRIVHIHRPAVGLRAIVAVDNTACGPAIGGVRMAPDASVEEAVRLARAMTLKNAVAGLPHGGGKSVVLAEPTIAAADKERLMRAFACAIRTLDDYIPGPDMGTDERCMAWIVDEIGRATGLPRELGGIPLDEIGATGRGLAEAIDVACGFVELELRGARVVVQGFGAVGRHAALVLAAKGALLVAASDSRGALVDPDGLDVSALVELKRAGRSLHEHPRGRRLDRGAEIDVECDIWIPAARPDVIRADNVARLRTRLVAEGANIPCTEEAGQALHERGVLVLPDFIANAGGVICAAVELRGGDEATALSTLERKIRDNTRVVLEEARRTGAAPRAVAVSLAEQRVRAAMRTRRFG